MLQYFTLSSHFTLFSFSLTIFIYTPNVSWVQPTLFIKYIFCLPFFMQVSDEYIPPSEAYLSIPIRTICRTVQLDLCTRNCLTDWKWPKQSVRGGGRIKVVSLYGFMYMYTHANVHSLGLFMQAVPVVSLIPYIWHNVMSNWAKYSATALGSGVAPVAWERVPLHIQTIEWVFVCVRV